MFCAALRTLSALTIVNSFHKTKTVLQDKCKSETESGSDANIVNNWQHLCHKPHAEVTLDDFIGVDTMPFSFSS
jgi:hypothetical protein